MPNSHSAASWAAGCERPIRLGRRGPGVQRRAVAIAEPAAAWTNAD
ncbi:MAG: hypothetical protein IPJ81_18545 [Chitinophagaceae bacterium]|nr:hypothetical protein [Chitinophagaceae bacterium]